jgi:hypothetical protein
LILSIRHCCLTRCECKKNNVSAGLKKEMATRRMHPVCRNEQVFQQKARENPDDKLHEIRIFTFDRVARGQCLQ